MTAEIPKIAARAIIPPTPPKIPKPLEKKVAKVFKWVKETLILGVIASSSARSIGSVIKEMSSSVKKGLTATKGFVVLLTPFSVQEVVQDVLAIGRGVVGFRKERKVADIARAAFNLVIHLDWVANAVASSCKIIYTFADVSAKTVNWVPIFGIVSFFVQFISLGMTAESVAKRGKLVYDFQKVMKQLDSAPPEDKAKILADFLKEFDEKGIQVLLKKLMISRKALYKGQKVKDRIASLAKDLLIEPGKKKEEIEEAEKFVRILAGRAKVILSLEVAGIANQIGTIVGIAFVTFAHMVVKVLPGAASGWRPSGREPLKVHQDNLPMLSQGYPCVI